MVKVLTVDDDRTIAEVLQKELGKGNLETACLEHTIESSSIKEYALESLYQE